ncbi:NAD-dependent epimerase/dehydratase family protein [Streptomyces chartreusis]|uniref:NAD-dependent epimerase/dehydratase family protein n=1 Tax=Streptomyces chartreusis TaxID=1969 RepID=UPI002E19A9F6|nr:NAD-dependent epimerase/dehydratase family protein [Streptomyces chartreusis]
MKVVLFGASGMVGQGVLRACLEDPEITEVVAVGRRPLGRSAPKLREVRHADFSDLTPIAGELSGADACFYCLGVSSVGLSHEAYEKITYDYTLEAARVVAADNPHVTFVYVSGEGTDSTEQGRVFWARVKGRTENALLAMDMRTYAFRPGWIQPVHGETSATRWYRLAYRFTSWLYPLLRRVTPRYVTSTEHLGRAMIAVTRLDGSGPHVLRTDQITRLGG